MTISNGADGLERQTAFAAIGVFAGALPGTISGFSTGFLTGSGKIDSLAVATLVVCVCGLAVAVYGWLMDRRHRTYPQQLLKSILDRRDGPTATA